MKKSSYIGLAIIIVIFAVIVVPKIFDRFINNATVDSSRSIKPGFKALDFIKINGEPKKVPEFLFLNQDSIYVSNEDYLGKVYVAEFFFTTCPSICPIMNKNLVEIQDEFEGASNFGIASFSIDPEHDTVQVLKEYAEFINVKSKNFVSLCERKLSKGSKVFVEGMLETRSWDNASGVKQWTTEIVLRPFKSELKILSSLQEKNEDNQIKPIVCEFNEPIDVIPF